MHPSLSVLACGALTALGLAQTTTRVSTGPTNFQGNSNSLWGAVSADGRYVAFQSYASNLVLSDANFHLPDVFVKDRLTSGVALASVSTGGVQGDSGSVTPSMSADGSRVAFTSLATNLVPGDANGTWDVFVRDLETGVTTRVSVDSSGGEADLGSHYPSISPNGRWVAFESDATNLVAGDVNGLRDVFVHDLATGETHVVSVGPAGAPADAASTDAAVSDEGLVAFASAATNLDPGDANGFADVFVRAAPAGAILRVVAPSGEPDGASRAPALSADGRALAFESDATNLVAGDVNGAADVFVRVLATGATEIASLDSAGGPAGGASALTGAAALSADGRFVAFDSLAPDLVAGDTNLAWDCFLRDRLTGTTFRVDLSASGAQVAGARAPAVSADGRFVAFESHASTVVPGDTNNVFDVFLRDRGPNAPVAFCSGDGGAGPCPCGNAGAPGRGCENSVQGGGALLAATGDASLSADTLSLSSSGEPATALTILAQGDLVIAPVAFGDGLRCVGGALKRLYSRNASAGSVGFPASGDASVSARSAALGDPIGIGASRFYYAYYRDPDPAFCPGPAGSTFNGSNALAVVWGL